MKPVEREHCRLKHRSSKHVVGVNTGFGCPERMVLDENIHYCRNKSLYKLEKMGCRALPAAV